MVSKITVIALVLIVSCPILLGYAMAFETHEKSAWNPSNEINITDIANNTTAWSYTAANTYSMNGRAIYDYFGNQLPQYPEYIQYQNAPATSLQLSVTTYEADTQIIIALGDVGNLIEVPYYGYDEMILRYTDLNMVVQTITIYDVVSVQWVGKHLTGSYHNLGNLISFDYPIAESIRFPNDDVKILANDGSTYVDPSYGWKVRYIGDYYPVWSLNQLQTSMFVMTIDLGGMTATTYSHDVRGSDSNVSVSITNYGGVLEINGTEVPSVHSGANLTSDKNVWQLVADSKGVRMNYIRDWPANYGTAAAYYTLNIDDTDQTYSGMLLNAGPKYRADYANVRSVSYAAMEDSAYDAKTILPDTTASYRINIVSADQIGSSLTWGGETYQITNGQITIGSKKIPVVGMKLDSIYEDGTRTNYINGTEISTGATTVTFGGLWSAIITQSQLNYETWEATEWTPGKFAWNGVDQSFALMGLITCAAVFVGLGMYGARSGAKVGKLMIICGCAAFVFLALM